MTSRTLRTLTVLTATAALCATAPAAHAAQDTGRRTPGIAAAWARAWNGTDPQALGALFTADGTYTDEAVGVTFRGRTGDRGVEGPRRHPHRRRPRHHPQPPASTATASPSGPSTPATSRARPSPSPCR